MKGYTIFDHAQLGHVEPTPVKKPPKQPKPAGRPPVARGWAVELGLGLGRQFTKGRK